MAVLVAVAALNAVSTPARAAPPSAPSASASSTSSTASAPTSVSSARPPAEDRPVADPPAEPTPEASRRAKELYNEGAAFVQSGDLQAAFRAFRGSYEQDGSAEALANMAVVERALGRSRAAAEHLDAALGKLPAAQAGKLDDLRQRLADICKDLTVVDLRVTAAGTQVYVDERWLGAGPLAHTVYVDPGDHVVIVRSASGREIRRRVDAKKGATESVHVGDAEVATLARADASTSPAPVPLLSAPESPSPAPWILGGVGLAFLGLGGAGLGVYLRAHDWRTRIENDTLRLGGSCSPPTPGFVDDCHARDQEATNETIGAVLGIAGGVGAGGLAIGGLLAWLQSSMSPPSTARDSSSTSARDARSPRVSVRVTPELGGLVVQGRF